MDFWTSNAVIVNKNSQSLEAECADNFDVNSEEIQDCYYMSIADVLLIMLIIIIVAIVLGMVRIVILHA